MAEPYIIGGLKKYFPVIFGLTIVALCCVTASCDDVEKALQQSIEDDIPQPADLPPQTNDLDISETNDVDIEDISTPPKEITDDIQNADKPDTVAEDITDTPKPQPDTTITQDTTASLDVAEDSQTVTPIDINQDSAIPDDTQSNIEDTVTVEVLLPETVEDTATADTKPPAPDINKPPLFTVCCSPFGTCNDKVSPKYCEEKGGNWMAGDSCDPNPCPPSGACCDPTAKICVKLTQKACENGGLDWVGSNTPCSPNPCVVLPGACCLPSGACTMKHKNECTALGGVFQGAGEICKDGLCPLPEFPKGCCIGGGGCKMLLEEDCKAEWGTPFDGTCADDETPCLGEGMGACCVPPDGTCKITKIPDCTGGIHLGVGVTCWTGSCIGILAPKWACCMEGGCKLVSEETCIENNGTFMVDALCAQNPCGSGGKGACCTKGGCFQATQKECIKEPYLYAGEGIECSEEACKDFVFGACCDVPLENCFPNYPKAFCDGNDKHKFMGKSSSCLPNPCKKQKGKKCKKPNDPVCDDGEPCTKDACNMSKGTCQSTVIPGCGEKTPCKTSKNPASNDIFINECVCQKQADCCTKAWSSQCVSIAKNDCGAKCSCDTMHPKDLTCASNNDCAFCATNDCDKWICQNAHCMPGSVDPDCE